MRRRSNVRWPQKESSDSLPSQVNGQAREEREAWTFWYGISDTVDEHGESKLSPKQRIPHVFGKFRV